MLHSSTPLNLDHEPITSYDRNIALNIDTGAYTIFTVHDTGFDGNIIVANSRTNILTIVTAPPTSRKYGFNGD